MLNRRALRVKAMQRLYAWNLCKQSNYEIALFNLETSLRDAFKVQYPQVWEFLEKKEEVDESAEKEEPQNNIEPRFRSFQKDEEQVPEKSFDLEDKKKEVLNPEIVQLKADIKTITDGFKLVAEEQNFEDLPVNEFKDDIVSEVKSYHSKVKQDFLYLRKEMELETEQIMAHYLMIIKLLIRFTTIASGATVKKKEKYSDPAFAKINILASIEKESDFVDAFIRHDIHWKDQQEFIHNLYMEAVYNGEAIKKFRTIAHPSLEEEREFLLELIRDDIFKNENFIAFFDEKDVNWKENKVTIRSMVGRSIKSVDSKDSKPALGVLSYNWEDDKQFLIDVYTQTIEHDNQYQRIIVKYVENWDADRLALTDLIIIKMALGEMINFTSIPVKVTINEYIEVSKLYSTAKSKQFVNGLLDKISKDLTKDGVVKKSGRGLLDNK